ncbi:MAG: hypothetical protein EOT04_02380 [Candidatus Chaera renei]|uniref:Uncharacterized protein n=1 Tax=Candidatus Chaera renei TaxID=2506947 RepID=A0A4Q0AIX2_9BACT|nr:MAG: hypothetical protein EOT04_02380 [Candidatus Chaera renei]
MSDSPTRSGSFSRLWQTPAWLKHSDWYFVEHILFLFFLAVLLWLFDSLAFWLFNYLSLAPNDRAAAYGPLEVSLPAVFVVAPLVLVLWRRQRGSLDLRQALATRKAHRWPLYAFVVVQVLTLVGLAIGLMTAVVGSLVGSQSFGQWFVTLFLPSLFAIALHAMSISVMAAQKSRPERGFVVNLSLGMFVGALVLLAVAAGSAGTNSKTAPPNSPYDNRPYPSYYNY